MIMILDGGYAASLNPRAAMHALLWLWLPCQCRLVAGGARLFNLDEGMARRACLRHVCRNGHGALARCELPVDALTRQSIVDSRPKTAIRKSTIVPRSISPPARRTDPHELARAVNEVDWLTRVAADSSRAATGACTRSPVGTPQRIPSKRNVRFANACLRDQPAKPAAPFWRLRLQRIREMRDRRSER